MAPIKMISAGGFVAVSCFGNRDATEDVDYILDPHIGNLQKAEEKLGAAIKDVTNQLGLADKWINDSMWVYSIGEPRKRLFKESIEQDQKLFSGRNLVIYAAKWQWALNRKLIRLSGDNPRERDLSDAVERIKRIIDASGRPLSRDLIKSWPTNSVDVIRDSVLDELATHFVAKFGTSPLL